MAIPTDILSEAKKLKEKYKYSSDPSVVRNPDGSLNFDDDKMDCSEFVLRSVKAATPSLYAKLIEKVAGNKDGGNTKTIQKGIKEIEGISDLTKLKQDNPLIGDWILWKDHIELMQDITAGGRYITLGANGRAGGDVPKNIDSSNFDKVKAIAANFLGIWTPRLSSSVLRNGASEEKLMMDVSFAPAGPIGDLKTAVHLRTNNPNATRIATPPAGQAYPLFEGEAMPFNTSNDANIKIKNISTIIDYLGVSKATNLRYIANGNDTFCNIYAYDVCYLMGFDIGNYYIPRVWWNKEAIKLIKNGQPQVPVYAKTVIELNANDLYDWFIEFGPGFGWLKETDPNALQEYVNSTGNIGIIVGKKPGGHGHITVVVPEQSAQPAGVFKAIRDAAGKVVNPLQSQAGRRNFEYGQLTNGTKPWFTASDHITAMYIFNQF